MNGEERTRWPHVLFGYDGTAENDAALRWAVEEARLRGIGLLMCHCWHWPYPAGHTDPEIETIMKRTGENLLDSGVRRAYELGVPGAVRKRLRRGPALEALLGAAGGAELVVIGTSGDPVDGSMALELPARSPCPVVAVREGDGPVPRRVVVGTDRSAGCRPAVGFAAEEARLRGWDLHVVYGCWEPGAVAESELALFHDRDRLAATRAAELEEAVEPVRRRYPDLRVEASPMLERPFDALREAADGAGLVVLGERAAGPGLGPLATGMLRRDRRTLAIVPSGWAPEPRAHGPGTPVPARQG
ncbi:Nucleotide-binding universal stress protein, UspA family [Actinomadura meyerae]|uniref:Nucleotide-binding universal stress protein, UspA family n=1 Tax=Actinomadura meyerae TaxID=240840 RepID=A0A239L3M2_9ACTN|nr:universal stress protein [Actinomadura meyerae]SNT24592.1 Nucleotide-binding universal stress protein, UspA family [Actinomadura meyerae]